MLDIAFVRQNTDIIRAANHARGVEVDLKKLIQLDDARVATASHDRSSVEYVKIMKQWVSIMGSIPNIADITTPHDGSIDLEVKAGLPFFSKPDGENQQKFIDKELFTRSRTTRNQLDTFCNEITHNFLQTTTYTDFTAKKQLAESRLNLPSLSVTPSTTALFSQSQSDASYFVVYEGEAQQQASLKALDDYKDKLSATLTALGIGYTLQLLSIKNLPHHAAKGYVFFDTPVINEKKNPIATLLFERDYISRETKRSYGVEGQRKYAHAVTVHFHSIVGIL